MSGDTLKESAAVAGLKDWKRHLNLIVVALVIVKALLMLFPCDAIDMAGYKAWSTHLATRGFDDFYETWHVVYAPGYMYLLWISGKLAAIFNLLPKAHELLIKIWSVAADLAGAYLIFKIGEKIGRERLGFWVGLIYALNPAVFFNSSVWGQFESIGATLLLLTVYCFLNDLGLIGVIAFVTAVLVKPQSAMLAPIAAALFFKEFTWRKFGLAVLAGLGTYLLIVIPFSAGKPIYWIVQHFIASGGDYPYATANAFNFWTILGGQSVADDLPFWGLTYAVWSLIFVGAVIGFVLWLVWRYGNSPAMVYWSAYLLTFGVFLFGSRMHERYLFPALIFLTVSLLWNARLWLPTVILSLCHFGNTFYIYIRGWLSVGSAHPALAGIRQWLVNRERVSISIWAPANDPVGLVIAWFTLAVFIYSLYITYERWNDLTAKKTE
ncbi:MAG: hypothetical protein GX075_06340 [Firmicutes bacterium]|nr:hypothetical protein [Bacillota bacterium]